MQLTELQNKANELLAQYNLNDWRFEIGKTVSSVGRCFHRQKKIEFSQYFLHIGEVNITDTLLHEIAHALVGPGHKHNYVWRAKAIEVGARPIRCKAVVPSKEPTYWGVCQCRKHPFYRKPTRTFKCRMCRTTLQLVSNDTVRMPKPVSNLKGISLKNLRGL
jgi:predicted SprT family Zn-dependent metalloprotease